MMDEVCEDGVSRVEGFEGLLLQQEPGFAPTATACVVTAWSRITAHVS